MPQNWMNTTLSNNPVYEEIEAVVRMYVYSGVKIKMNLTPADIAN